MTKQLILMSWINQDLSCLYHNYIIKENLPTSLVKKSQAPLKPPPPGSKPGSDDVVTVTIEEGVYSLNNPEFEHRDKTVNPDVMD